MEKKTWIILGVVVIAVLGLIGVSVAQSKNSRIKTDNHAQMFEPREENGFIAENIDGDPDAPVKIYEYGDYQCTGCAPMNPYINQLLEEYDGKVAVVFRTTIMSYHQNGTAAAAAANAAAQQGYWKEYKDLLFTNQSEWYYSESEQRQQQFEAYFLKVSDGKGDLSKFRTDMGSAAIRKKIQFDEDLAAIAEVQFTPNFFIEETFVDQRNPEDLETTIPVEDYLNMLRAEIDKRLEAQGIKVEKKTEDKAEDKK